LPRRQLHFPCKTALRRPDERAKDDKKHIQHLLLSGSGFGRFDIHNVNFKDAQAEEKERES